MGSRTLGSLAISILLGAAAPAWAIPVVEIGVPMSKGHAERTASAAGSLFASPRLEIGSAKDFVRIMSKTDLTFPAVRASVAPVTAEIRLAAAAVLDKPGTDALG